MASSCSNLGGMGVFGACAAWVREGVLTFKAGRVFGGVAGGRQARWGIWRSPVEVVGRSSKVPARAGCEQGQGARKGRVPARAGRERGQSGRARERAGREKGQGAKK
eukprot:354695-Chlamydomonas_euryale.AAC.7